MNRTVAVTALVLAATAACSSTSTQGGAPDNDASAGSAGAGGTGTRDSGADAPVDEGAEVADAELTDADATADFLSTEVLGRPTASSVGVSAAPKDELEVYFEVGTASGAYGAQTKPATCAAGLPFVTTLDGLEGNTQYFYRMRWRKPGASVFGAGPEHAFHTARPKNTPFVFTMQADPHLDEQSDLNLYKVALDNELADAPDFMIDLGDTFMCEKHTQPFDATVQAAQDPAVVNARYLFEHGNFGRIAHSVPLLLVNGNHEGEAGWLNDGTPSNLAVWTTQARKAFFPVPEDGPFFSSPDMADPIVGKRGAWYSWTWGDALFVVLDPCWYTATKTKTDGWVWTLGEQQYDWLQETLQKSDAPFRFVFVHNLVGGLLGLARGGVEAAPFYEWGGQNEDGTAGFASHRPGWAKPIHQVLVDNHVTAVFHGHDHVYVKQELGGIVYQELPQPSSPNYGSGPQLAAKQTYESGVIMSSSGHLRVSVSATETMVEYVRAYRPEDETGGVANRDVSDSYTMIPR